MLRDAVGRTRWRECGRPFEDRMACFEYRQKQEAINTWREENKYRQNIYQKLVESKYDFLSLRLGRACWLAVEALLVV